MKKLIFIFLITLSFISCNNNREEKREINNESDSVSNHDLITTIPGEEDQSKQAIQKIDSIKKAGLDTNGNAARSMAMKKVNIEVKTFRNIETTGFGYDIILDGHVYVHQPNIPAVPGNNGFSSEKKARQAAELVSFKIRNNILPPTVDIRELDSLNLR